MLALVRLSAKAHLPVQAPGGPGLPASLTPQGSPAAFCTRFFTGMVCTPYREWDSPSHAWWGERGNLGPATLVGTAVLPYGAPEGSSKTQSPYWAPMAPRVRSLISRGGAPSQAPTGLSWSPRGPERAQAQGGGQHTSVAEVT